MSKREDAKQALVDCLREITDKAGIWYIFDKAKIEEIVDKIIDAAKEELKEEFGLRK